LRIARGLNMLRIHKTRGFQIILPILFNPQSAIRNPQSHSLAL
jgi:hypothetical protein